MTAQPPKRTLLAGLGNPLAGDDGFGSRVLDAFAHASPILPPELTLLDAGTDLLNSIESFAGYDRVLLVDAILDAEAKVGPPGRVVFLDEGSFLSWSEGSQGVHQLSPLLGIKLFRALHPDAQTEIYLVGLFVDQLSHYPIYMTDETIQEAVTMILRVFEP